MSTNLIQFPTPESRYHLPTGFFAEDRELKIRVSRAMDIAAEEHPRVTATEIAENAAYQFGHDEWLETRITGCGSWP